MKNIFENIIVHPFYNFLKSVPHKFNYFHYETELDEVGGDVSGQWPDDLHYKEIDRISNHIKNNPIRAKKYNWITSEGNIHWPTYHTNKFGFRTSLEYKNGTSIALGCSYTFGLGVHEEHIWPYLLSKEIDKDIINLGVCGGSMDSSYRILKAYLEEYTPEYVFISIPSVLRQELFYRRDDNKIGTLRIMPNISKWIEDDTEKKAYDISFKYFYSLDENLYLNFYKNLEAIRYLCSVNGVKLIEQLNHAMYNEMAEQHNITFEKTPSFDILHYGPEVHELISNEFKKLI